MALVTFAEKQSNLPLELQKRDQTEVYVSQKLEEQDLLKAVGDDSARSVLMSIIARPKSAVDITNETKIPISSVYRKIHWLENAHLIKVKGFVITGEGKKYHLYESKVRTVRIALTGSEIRVEFTNYDGKRYIPAKKEQEIPIQ